MPDVTPPPDPPPNPPPRTAFEWSLSALRPADADVARPSFMYKAGQASRDKAVRTWRWVAGGSALAAFVAMGVAFAAVMFAFTAASRDRRTPEQPVVFEPPPVSTTPELPPPEPLPPRPVVPYPRDTITPTDPTPAEIAAALARRRELLVGGLGLLPPAPQPAPAPDRPLTPNTGVFAAPR